MRRATYLYAVIAITLSFASVVLARPFLSGGQGPVLSGPQAEWQLNAGDITGTTVADLSGNNNTATVVGGPLTFGAMGANFNGSSQYLDSRLVPTGTGLTIAAWFNATSLTGGPRIVANSHTDVDFKGFQLGLNDSGGNFDVGNGTTSARALWSPQLTAGRWYYYVGTYDGATVKAYLNGAQVASTSFVGGAIAAGTGPDINVARAPSGISYFTGAVYDVRLYNRALSASEIAGLYNANNTPVAVSFSTNPVSIVDTAGAGVTVTPFQVVIANGTAYGGSPTVASCSQSPCPFTIGGSTGNWIVKTAAALNSSYDATNQPFVVNAP